MFNPLQWLAGLLNFEPVAATPVSHKRGNPAGSKLARKAMEGNVGQKRTTQFGRNIASRIALQQKAEMRRRKKLKLVKNSAAIANMQAAAQATTKNPGVQ